MYKNHIVAHVLVKVLLSLQLGTFLLVKSKNHMVARVGFVKSWIHMPISIWGKPDTSPMPQFQRTLSQNAKNEKKSIQSIHHHRIEYKNFSGQDRQYIRSPVLCSFLRDSPRSYLLRPFCLRGYTHKRLSGLNDSLLTDRIRF